MEDQNEETLYIVHLYKVNEKNHKRHEFPYETKYAFLWIDSIPCLRLNMVPTIGGLLSTFQKKDSEMPSMASLIASVKEFLCGFS